MGRGGGGDVTLTKIVRKVEVEGHGCIHMQEISGSVQFFRRYLSYESSWP